MTDVEIPEGSIRYHSEWLRGKDLIREADREAIDRGRDAIVWSLTDAGQQLLKAIDEELGRGDRPQTIERLNDRIDELENDLEAIKSEFDRMATLVEDHHERLEPRE